MSKYLKVSTGQHSDKGRKPSNQDFHGYTMPAEPRLGMKGIAFAMADGVSSSDVSHIASETAVKSFLDDYFCTSEAWSVRKSAERVLTATNSWLHAQTRNSPYRYEKDKGYVCTLSALVLKGSMAHLFHVGDTRIYRLRDKALEQLTNDHRLWLSQDENYLSRALGVDSLLEIDYQSLPLRQGDIFVLATDGVYEHASAQQLISTINQYPDDLDEAARSMVKAAFDSGSEDNLSVQVVRIEQLPEQASTELQRQAENLPFPPILEPRQTFDGYTILREIHATSRSHVYLALNIASDTRVVLKTPSIDLRGDPGYLERFLMEEWIARRVNSAHVLKAGLQNRQRNYLYTVTEYIEGQTLKQWLIDNPKPDLEVVRGLVVQIARGLYALHRMEILHQDIRPDNILIDTNGTAKIIDFGSARVAGIVESTTLEPNDIPGTALYMAPEYFMGETGTDCSDLYSLGVLTYHMLSGRFPYGTQVAKSRTASAMRRLNYASVLDDDREIPAWIDETIKKAVHPNPDKRYQELSEFTFDLRHPNPAFLNKTRAPLLERNPVAFWQGVSALLACALIYLLTT
ncbi:MULTISPECIES: bifunctional protein-serine/threonine kinase/phosphatase [Marinobacter]|uniref:bifunctional protein-serine/threonine kinase/phosphatase n=1 Tax=Marinobacter TaxID=2742 RepID=UPI001246755A|nr:MULTISPECIES: bifunctional protein-serine/threonine kinase/phosphatase [Marinobacter]MBL3555168.1 bifunctional protein-serine/threonine kinase/phosphatase [Marinobacter sp. JB05H06]